ncbi:MAG: LUD domain-containing protein [Bacteroidales bacterium]
MEESTPKEKVLKKIREALVESNESNSPNIDLDETLFYDSTDFLDVAFAEKFVRLGGQFVFCEGVQETIDSIRFFAQKEQWSSIFCCEKIIQRILTHAGLTYSEDANELILKKVGFSSCKYLLARTGSIMYSSANSGRRMYANVDTLVFVATIDQLVWDMKTAYRLLKEKSLGKMPSMLNTITGLSEYVDIDGEKVGALGPKKMFLFLVEPNSITKK